MVSRLRLTEEKDFCRDIAFDLALGGFVDAPLRGRHPFKDSIQNALEDTKIFSEKIRAILESIAHPKSNQAKPLLLCPIGIGNHIDHLIVLNVIVQNLDPIRAKFRVGFYEDLPYASKSQNRQVGIDRLHTLTDNTPLIRCIVEVADIAQKIKAIGYYRSQILDAPLLMADYSPNLAEDAPHHEAVWFFADDIQP